MSSILPQSMSKEELVAKMRAARLAAQPQVGNGTVAQPSQSATPVPTSLQLLAAKAKQLREEPAPPPPPVRKVLATSPELGQRCSALEAACQTLADELLLAEPQLGDFLADIHEHLRAEPELMHILTDEQIAAVYQGFIAQSGKSIATVKPKKPATAAKIALAQGVSDDDM